MVIICVFRFNVEIGRSAKGRETTTTSSASTRLPNLTSSRTRPSNGQDPLKRGSKVGLAQTCCVLLLRPLIDQYYVLVGPRCH